MSTTPRRSSSVTLDGRVKAARYLADVTSTPGIYLDADPDLPTRRHPDLQRELALLAP
jgi:hypothetical protein